MAKYLISLIWAFLVVISVQADIPEKPSNPQLVNDFAHIFSTDEAQALEYKLRKYNDTTSTQIAVVTVESLDGYDIAQYGQELGDKWGIGQKSKNNGVLILISKTDRNVNISTGYGMEGVLPDVICKRIIDRIIVPAFKQGNYYGGIDEATSVIIGLASGTYKADKIGKGGSWKSYGFVLLLIILFVVLPMINRANRLKNSNYGSRGLDFWTLLALMASSGGNSRSSGNDGWGGGFDGFGGGGFGGGGASGRW
ncbi:MAG: TPM domain-containing protein [Cytophagales bacterium]|nr:TPM domain-containing protein [Cytophagales bacterium]